MSSTTDELVEVSMVTEVVEESPKEDNTTSSEISSIEVAMETVGQDSIINIVQQKSVGVAEPECVASHGEASAMETVEYAISQVVGGAGEEPADVSVDLDSNSNIVELVKSTLVTIPEPVDDTQREAIVKLAKQESVGQAAEQFNVPSAIIEQWMASGSGQRSPQGKVKVHSPGQSRKLSYSQKLDEAVAAHVREVLGQGEHMTKQEVCHYAKKVIQEENPDFIASSGWAQRFLARHSIELGKPKKRPVVSLETRGRPLTYATETDKAIATYVKSKLSDGQVMTNSELRKYAKEVICRENPNFTGSASWAQNFLLRHKIALQGTVMDPVSMTSSANSLLSQAHLSSPTMSMASISSSLSDSPLGPAAEITPTSGASVYADIPTSGAMDVSIVDESMKTALAILTGENIDSAILSTSQAAALQSSLSELTSDPVSLMGLLNNAHQMQDGSGEGGVALITHGLESPSGNIYLGLGGSDAFGGLPALTQIDPNTQTPLPTVTSRPSTSREAIHEAIAQASRPLSYTKETDQVLANWVQEQQASGKKVTFASLRTYAKKLISSENPNFNASVGWVTPFLLRHNLDLNVNKKQTRKGNNPRKISSEDSKEDSLEEMGEGESQLHTADPPTISPEVLAMVTSLAEQVQSAGQALQEQQALQQQQQALQGQRVLQQQPVLQDQQVSHEQQALDHQQASRGAEGNADTGEGGGASSAEKQMSEEQPLPSSEGVSANAAAVEVEGTMDEKKPTPKNWRREKPRRRHTLAEKLEVVQLMKERNMAAHHVCRMLGIANSTFAGWTKLVQQKKSELEALSTNKKRANVSGQGRPLSYNKEKDEQIAEWVRCQQALGIQVTPAELSKRATTVISEENPNFTASSGWQQKFLQRHNLQLTTSWGSKSSASPSSTTALEGKETTEQTQEVEDQGSIPAPVQTEEVVSNEITADKPFSDELDDQLAKWTREQVKENGSLGVQNFCKQVEGMVVDENPSSQFVATLGWAFRFLHRHNILLDPKPTTAVVDSSASRKRSSMASTPDQSLLATPKKLNLGEDMSVSPSTGNLCEALLALSNQSGEGGETSSQSLQAAVQTIQQALQQQQAIQALQQRQQQLDQQQQPVKPDNQDEASLAAGLAMTPGGSTNTYFGKPAREFTAEEKEEVVRYANATTLQKAALKYGVAAPTVWRWRVELKLHQPKYTSMQKKYIIKFAETNSLKEAAQRYGITGKTIQNWRRALQSDGEIPSGCISDDPANIPEPVEPMDLAPPTSGADESGSSEVVTYDNQNFQFIVDGGEVIDTGGRGEQGGRGSLVNMPLEVTSEVDIENVGMEYDVVSTEGHAAKPRCTPEEKMQILKYALDHSVREASQKFGISPGTLYYWKKSASSSGGNGASALAAPGPSTSPSKVTGDKSTLTSTTGNESVLVQYTGVGGDTNVLKLLGAHSVSSEPVTVSPEQFIATSSVALAGLQSLSPDISFLQAVSSMLSSADTEADPAHRRKSNTPRRHDSTSGGICSPTEVLVQPFQTTVTSTSSEQPSQDKPLVSEADVLNENVDTVVEVIDNNNGSSEREVLKIDQVQSTLDSKQIAESATVEATEVSVTSNDATTSVAADEMTETIETVVQDISQTVELSEETTVPADGETVELNADGALTSVSLTTSEVHET